MHGLLERDLMYIAEALDGNREINKAVLFGSRAIGNYKRGSDVDLALLGERVDAKTVRTISDKLNEEYPIPYFFDVLNYNGISNKELKDHIDEKGIVIYNRS